MGRLSASFLQLDSRFPQRFEHGEHGGCAIMWILFDVAAAPVSYQHVSHQIQVPRRRAGVLAHAINPPPQVVQLI
jgi:hypothetical protein